MSGSQRKIGEFFKARGDSTAAISSRTDDNGKLNGEKGKKIVEKVALVRYESKADDSDEEEEYQKVEQKSKRPRKKAKIVEHESNSEEETPKPSKGKKSKKIVEDSESENDKPKRGSKNKKSRIIEEESNSEDEKPKRGSKSKKSKIVEEESDSEDEKPKRKSKTKKSKRVEDSDSEDEKPKRGSKSKKSKIVEESDSEDEKPKRKSKTKKSKRVEDDSDSEDEKPTRKSKSTNLKKIEEEDDEMESECKAKKMKNDSVDSADYEPAKDDYDPVDDAPWSEGQKVPYLFLAKTLSEIEQVSKRNTMIDILSNYLSSVIALSPDNLLASIYLCLNKLGPDYEGLELGLGQHMVIKALALATGRKVDQIKADVQKKGDLGVVAELSRMKQSIIQAPPKLTVLKVFQKFKELAAIKGQSSSAKKEDEIRKLLVACRESEAKYICRSLTGKLRIGLAEQSIILALAKAYTTHTSSGISTTAFKKKQTEAVKLLKTAYCECPSYDKILDVLMKDGIISLPTKCHITPGIPVKPMLAHPTKGIHDVLKRFDDSEYTCEYKYDGERAQVHLKEGGNVFIYSRNGENNTSKYPDIASRIPDLINEGVESFILDCEAVAWDIKKKQILPFQVLSTRKRKDAVESEITVNVCLHAFDLLYLNGESMVKSTFRERREKLKSSFNEVEGKFVFATFRDIKTTEEVQEFFDESLKGKCEGLMLKTLDDNATYEISKRSHSWLKLKKDYLDGIGDTIDVVVIGGYFGKGKRTGFYGGYLLACYDPENEEFQDICNIGTGFKDEDLENFSKFFKERVIDEPKPYYACSHHIKPDVWFDAVQVWEIKCADLSISPRHRAAYGLVERDKGISLRFPRFIRVRDDKKPSDATSSTQIAEMYSNQEQVKTKSDADGNDDDDDY